ncbi:MAG: putative sulfate/molybdate transporter [Dehalococcoidia bacterium]
MQVKSFRFTLWELSGALGDIGILLPLLVALIVVNNVSSTGAFLVVGLAYIFTGLYYRIPMPVQPLKAVAAIAIATGLSASVIAASGLLMAVVLLLLALTGIITAVAKLFPKAIIRGIQLGIALLLIKAGVALANKSQVFIGGQGASLSSSLDVPVGWLLAIAAGILLIVFLRKRWLPASLVILTFGLGAGAFLGPIEGLAQLRLGLALPSLGLPSLSDFSTALLILVLPQVPLTLGNAVFATADTARSYFGDKAQRVTHKSLVTTTGVANLAAGALGGIGVCHGSGGVTAHFKLGARTGGANLMIGSVFLGLALFLDGNLLPLLSLIPYPILGVMVAFVGLQHALLARDLQGWLNIAVAILIAVVALATSNLALGFALGIVLLQGQKFVGGLSRLIAAHHPKGYRGHSGVALVALRAIASAAAPLTGTVKRLSRMFNRAQKEAWHP